MAGFHEQSRLRAVVDTAVDGVILIDAQGIILMFNPACEHLFGYASFEVIGRNVKMLMPDPYQHEHDSTCDNYRETGDTQNHRHRPRSAWAASAAARPFPMDLSVGEAEEDGEPILSASSATSPNARPPNRRCAKAAARLRAVVETAVDGVIMIDAHGRVLMFNPACERLFGYRGDGDHRPERENAHAAALSPGA